MQCHIVTCLCLIISMQCHVVSWVHPTIPLQYSVVPLKFPILPEPCHLCHYYVLLYKQNALLWLLCYHRALLCHDNILLNYHYTIFCHKCVPWHHHGLCNHHTLFFSSTMPHYVITIFYCVMIMAYLNTTMLYYTITMFPTVPYSIQLCYGALLYHHNGFLCSNNVGLVFSCAIAISHCAIKKPLLPSQCFIMPAVLYCVINRPTLDPLK